MTSPSNEDWLDILRADIDATGSISKTAQRIGVSRPAISQILNGIGPYGTGKASTQRIAEKVMNTIGLVICPFLTNYHGQEHKITGVRCREYSDRSAPTSSPRQMQHWRACQACEKRATKPTESTVAMPPKRNKGKDDEPVQQAGIIDKVTLPLPEVGGPQIQLTTEVES